MGKYEGEEQELELLLYQPQTIDSTQNISGTILLKLPSLRATVPPSTSAVHHVFPSTPLHVQSWSFSASWSAQNLIAGFGRFQLELASRLFALVPMHGAEQKHALSSASAPDQMKGPWTPVCSGSVVHFGNWSRSHNSLLLLWGVQTNLTLKTLS